MSEPRDEFDAIVVGAGAAGLYMLHRLREMGLTALALETGDGVGGTWFWNRYPGARCDVPSLEYSFGFSEELQQGWEWSEIMPAQSEVLAYLNHVADRFDLRRDIRFETRLSAATYDESARRWRLATDAGDVLSARFCVMATGCLSAPLRPDFEGLDRFEGDVHYTSGWPREGVDLSGRRVGVIGTGSSGVQCIPILAEQADHLYVFQRTPVYTFPADNAPLEPDFQSFVKANYREIRKKQRASDTGVSEHAQGALFSTPTRRLLDLSAVERAAALEDLGFGVVRSFADIRTETAANEIAVEMYREMIRRTIDDPLVAERLCPREHPIGCKRQVVDTDYFITFNRPDVTLIDLREGGIEAITPTGLRTTNGEYEFDVLVLATGFDAMTGALRRIDIRGRHDRTLASKWADGPRAYLGLLSADFPNLFTITGPGSPSVLSNMMHSIEQHVDWIADCIGHMGENGFDEIEPAVDAEDEWVAHVIDEADGTVWTAPSCRSWYLGANVPGKRRIFMPYTGGVKKYRAKCDEVVARDYEGFVFTRSGRTEPAPAGF